MSATTSSSSNPVSARLAAIRYTFLSELPDRRDELAQVLDGIDRSAEREDRLTRALRIAHRLAGVSGTLGFPILGRRAMEAQEALQKAIALPKGSGPETRALAALSTLLGAMTQVCETREDVRKDS